MVVWTPASPSECMYLPRSGRWSSHGSCSSCWLLQGWSTSLIDVSGHRVYHMWIHKWYQYNHSSTSDVFKKLVDTLQTCSHTEFPNICYFYYFLWEWEKFQPAQANKSLSSLYDVWSNNVNSPILSLTAAGSRHWHCEWLLIVTNTQAPRH